MSTNIDPIDKHPKPAFRPWMRRLDPLLAAEDTNPIFEAFRRRRRVHRRRFSLRGAGATVPPGYVLGVAAAAVVTLMLFYFCGCFALVLLPGAIALLHTRYGRGRITSQTLPLRVDRVFAGSGFLESAALDIWMTGCGGATVAEALYLEHRENSTDAVLIAMIGLGSLLGTALFAGIVAWGNWLLLPVFVVTWLWLLFEVTLASVTSSSTNSMRTAVRQRMRIWTGSSELGSELAKGCGSILLIGAVIIVAVLALTLCLTGLGHLDSAYPGAMAIAGQVGAWLGVLFFAGLAFWARWYRHYLLERIEARAQQEFTAAAYAFETFMRSVVASDPDVAQSQGKIAMKSR